MNILNFVRSKELKAYWIDTSENYLINHVIKNAGEDLFDALKELLAGKSVEETITGNSSMSTLLTQQEIWELMLFSGYLTIDKKIERNQYLVKIPNKEVQDFFKDILGEKGKMYINFIWRIQQILQCYEGFERK